MFFEWADPGRVLMDIVNENIHFDSIGFVFLKQIDPWWVYNLLIL